MKAGFLSIPFCLASGVGQFSEAFEAASEIRDETLLLTGCQPWGGTA